MPVSLQITLSVVGTLVTLAAYYPYLTSLFKRETQPHLYTWLIWCITASTATAGLWYGGAGVWAFGSYVIGTSMTFVIVVLSLTYGTKNITTSDTLVLALALLAIVVWWQLNAPVIALLMVTAIDASGYIPTYRKLWYEPWTEDLLAWTLLMAGPLFIIGSMAEHNVMTVTYAAMTVTANCIVILLSLYRRQIIPKTVHG